MPFKKHQKTIFVILFSLTLLIINITGCSIFNPCNKYSRYHDSTNMDKYKYGVQGLVEILLGDYDDYIKWKAAVVLRDFALNRTNGARTIFLNNAVPGLLKALRVTDEGIHVNIIRPLMEIKPDLDTVAPGYEYVILNDNDKMAVCAALWAFSYYGEEAIEYIPLIADTMGHIDPRIRACAITVLGEFGRYATEYLDKLRKISALAQNDYVWRSADEAIEKIEKDIGDNGNNL